MIARAVVTFAVLALGLVVVRDISFSQSPGDKLPPPQRLSKFDFLGANSCSAAACHNGIRSEYSTWISKDSHARAYDVLFNEVSLTISKNLNRPPAHEDTLCLSCHVHPRFVETKHPDGFRNDGVSCESCHGPAERWLAEHFRPDWKGKTAKEKLDLGMCDTRSLVGRAKVCVDCHVGSANAEVNHDLIAAGHPRLNFEFGGSHARMPHHWPDAKDKDPSYGGTPDFEARAWAIGEVVTAKAALELLAFRASEGKSTQHSVPGTQYSVLSTPKVWPEFAEYDCYKCHQSLTARAGQRSEPGRKTGMLFWNRWYLAMTPEVLTNPDCAKLIDDVRSAMEARRPDRMEVVRRSTVAAEQLEAWLSAPRFPDVVPAADWLKRMARAKAGSTFSTWDEAARVYLALAAMHHAARDMNDPTLTPSAREALDMMNRELRFPPNQTGPRDFRPDLLRDTLRKLQ